MKVTDIEKLKERNDQYNRELEKVSKQLEIEKREAWIRNQKRRDPSFNEEPSSQQEQEWKESSVLHQDEHNYPSEYV